VSTAHSNGSIVRFNRGNTCPVCGGSDTDPRGQGQRCHGFLSGDRKTIFCAREEHAARCRFDAASECYAHNAKGPCPCGQEHAPADPAPARNGRRGEIDHVYKYRDAAGQVVFEVVRFKNPKDFRQRQPIGGGRHAWNLKGVNRVLYNLPAILAADPAVPTWIVEGEKDADALGARGLLATTCAEGAGKWRDEYADVLKGRPCYIVPDNDQKGRDHAQQVAQSLRGKAASVKIVELPGLPEKGDVSDFLAAGGTVDRLNELAAAAAEWRPPDDRRRDQVEVNEAADDPHRLARIHLGASEHQGQPTLRFYRDETLEWRDGAYRAVAESELRCRLNETIKAEFDRLNVAAIEFWEGREGKDEDGKPAEKPTARKVTRTIVSNAAAALQSMTLIPGKTEVPAWLGVESPFDPKEIVPIRNALIHLPGIAKLISSERPNGAIIDPARMILRPTPQFFSTYALDFHFNVKASEPKELLKFLGSQWPDDQASIDLLQEWIGYLLTPDLSHQKILVLIGPKRSGRGTIARLIAALLGSDNVANPTLAGLASNFGLSPLIGKLAAIVGDARISSRTDWAVIVERMLSISGEDSLTIDRKHLPPWTGKLLTRLMVISNELPRLPDQSGALVSRYLMLLFTESFLGREDKSLDAKLHAELPSIFLWAVEGWRRLRERGHFLQPKSGQGLIDQAYDIGSPVGAYVRDRVKREPGAQCTVELLFGDWRAWCEEKGRQPGNEMSFGRDLRSVIPALEIKRRRGDFYLNEKPYVRYYEGIRLKTREDEDKEWNCSVPQCSAEQTNARDTRSENDREGTKQESDAVTHAMECSAEHRATPPDLAAVGAGRQIDHRNLDEDCF
jgi:putative DNA primase/helicase